MADHKRFKDLDELEKVLKKNTPEEQAQRRQRQKRAAAKKRARQGQYREEVRMLFIPLLVVVLMIIILIAEAVRGNSGTASEADAAQTTAVSDAAEQSASSDVSSGAAAETETTADPTIVREYHDNTLEDFIDAYFDAKLAQDTDTLYAMAGVTNQTETQTAALKAQLKAQAGYIEDYQDIRLHAVSGLEENSRLVFVTYNVKFRRVETLAPGIMYCYIRVTDQNTYEIVENMSPEQVRFVNDYIQNHEEVRMLMDSTNSSLLQALSSDQRLAVVYNAFMTGRIYTEDQAVIDSEVSLVEVRTEASTEAEAEQTEAETEAQRDGGSAEREVSVETTAAPAAETSTEVVPVVAETTAAAASEARPVETAVPAETTSAAAIGPGETAAPAEGPVVPVVQ